MRLATRLDGYGGLPRNDARVAVEWGDAFNGGATRLGAFATYYRRGRVNSRDDPRWAEADLRPRVPDPAFRTAVFLNTSNNSGYGQYDVRPDVSRTGLPGAVTDAHGEFETYPSGDGRCRYPINAEVCGAPDGQGIHRYNLNENRDLHSELQRLNAYAYLEHDLGNDLEAFGEFAVYWSDSNAVSHPTGRLGSVGKFRMAAHAHYNPLGPCGSPNRLPDSVLGAGVPCRGLQLELDNYRFTQVPRIVDVDGATWRAVGGLRGSAGAWAWEAAYLWSKAGRLDVTRNGISNTRMTEALNDATPAGFNPFAPSGGSNIERTLVDVYRRNEQRLALVDFKASRHDLFELPAGPVGVLAGAEWREERFVDDLDPRLDGQIAFTDTRRATYPFVSDVANWSPTADSAGGRRVGSVFAELAVPLLAGLDLQAAVRREQFSDVGGATVGKLAAGYRVHRRVLLRASRSDAFRAPNLVTVNQSLVARTTGRRDYGCLYLDPDQAVLDCRYGIQRLARGSLGLAPERSDNASLGIVIGPVAGLTVTYDRWSIEKTDTVGLFGEENHIALDLLMRLRAGDADCASVKGNPAVSRNPEVDGDYRALSGAAGLCPFGEVLQVHDDYANLDTRTVAGRDVAVYFRRDTRLGAFDLRYTGTWLDEYRQEAGGPAAVLVQARASGELPGSVPVVGFTGLIGRDGNPQRKDSFRLSWARGDWGASLTGLRYGDFFQVLSDGRSWPIPSMTTFNVSAVHERRLFGVPASLRAGINNVTDERAPLADAYFGFFADQHRDLGRYHYVELRLRLTD